ECDLQGEHQKSTLQHLGLELSKILLRLNAPQPYSAPESQPMPLAAEAEVAYGKKADKSTSQRADDSKSRKFEDSKIR
ncbi:MAG: hypothetical protein SPH08_00080, partial [Sodaliphilus sp.]|nr:hypothetical protein [Sodaliphilus sp.]